MRYRKLGKTGWDVSVIGLGTWGLGGEWGEVATETAHATIRAAHDAGVNFFDTADIYGEPQGRAEELLGEAVRPFRDKVFIATKAGNWGSRHGHAIPMAHPSAIELCCDASLYRLKTDYIDLYQCHMRFPPDVGVFLEAFDRLKERGKIRAGGISTDSLDVVTRFNRGGACDAVQCDYNILDRSAEAGILPYCARENIGVIARRPLASGVASAKFSQNSQFNDAVRHGWNQGSERKNFLERISLADRITFLQTPDRTVAQGALQFVISNPAVSVAIPGAKTPEQARANAAAGDGGLTEAELRRIDEIAPVRQPPNTGGLRPVRIAKRLVRRVLRGR